MCSKERRWKVLVLARCGHAHCVPNDATSFFFFPWPRSVGRGGTHKQHLENKKTMRARLVNELKEDIDSMKALNGRKG